MRAIINKIPLVIRKSYFWGELRKKKLAFMHSLVGSYRCIRLCRTVNVNDNFENLVAEGFRIERIRGEDKSVVLDVLNTGGFGECDSFTYNELYGKYLVHGGEVAIFYGHECMAVCAPVIPNKEHPNIGQLGTVSVRPEGRGYGLGTILINASIKVLADAGCVEIAVITQDYRLPAVAAYLKAGFRPCFQPDDKAMQSRWENILKILPSWSKLKLSPHEHTYIPAYVLVEGQPDVIPFRLFIKQHLFRAIPNKKYHEVEN